MDANQRLAELHAAAAIRHRKVKAYARVPLDLAGAVARATGGQRMMVWIWLLHRTWQQQTPSVVVSTAALRKYGISRETKRTALKRLEAAGLITVEWRANKNPIVSANG
jgi:hypothetical protein